MGKIDRELEVVGFAASAVLPGEDQALFNQLLQALRAQYQPQGIAQEDAVRTMAAAIWRKRCLGIFQRAEEARIRWGRYFHHPNDRAGLLTIMVEALQASLAEGERVAQLDQAAKDPAAAAAIPNNGRSNEPIEAPAASEAQFVGPFRDVAILMKISAALQDFCLSYEKASPPAQASVELGEQVWSQIMLAQAGDLITPASYLAELRMIEKLDQVIGRSHNRLMKMKKDLKRNATSLGGVSSLSPSWATRRR